MPSAEGWKAASRALVFPEGWASFPVVSLLRTTMTRSAGARVDKPSSAAKPTLTLMNAHLLAAASKVVPPDLLVNMVSRRVRQLTIGHRPLVQAKPGALASDIALAEIIEGKLTWRPATSEDDLAVVVPFPGVPSIGKKAA